MKSRLFAAASISALLLGVAACATAPAADMSPDMAMNDDAPVASTAPDAIVVPPLGFRERTLPNGLKVYTARDTATSNVTVQVWYKVGAKDDPEGRSGFAHLFEHLMFKATRNLPQETFDRLTEDVGGSNNASTYLDLTNYYETVPAQHLERMLFAESERMGSLVVDETSFGSERDVVKEEFRLRVLSTPYGRFQRLHSQAFIYQDSPYRRPGIGSIADLDSATMDDVLRFHETFYRPDNAYLIVAGNFDQAQLDRWIDGYFGGIENPARPLPVNNVPESYGPAREATFYGPNVPLPMVQISWPTVPYNHPDRAALSVLDGILSTGESSRLYQALVYRQQIATTASSSTDQQQQVGVLNTFAIMSEGKTADEGLAALRAEVARIRDEPVTEAELAEAKTELVAGALRGLETIDGRAFQLGYTLIMTGDPTAADRDIPDIQRVTVADIQRVARQYLRDDRAIAMRYLQADDAHPASTVQEVFTAPVTLAELAPAGEPVTLLPEGQRAQLPEPGAAVEAATPQVAERRLANGMRVLVAPKPGLPLVSARLSFEAGTSDDAAGGKAGVANFTASLLTQGTNTRSAPEIATEIERLGANIGAGAGVDFTNVFASSPSNVFPQVMELLADVVRNPAFTAEDLEREQTQTLNGLRVQLSQPGPVAGIAATRAVYGNAPYGIPGSGTPSTIPTITRDDLVAFHGGMYQPSNATLVFSGDITPEAAYALAEQAFGNWQAGAARAPVADPAGPAVAPRVIVIDQPGAGQAAVYAAMRGIARTDEDYFPLVVANGVMGGGFSARLSQEIRIKRGLSYGAYSSLSAREDEGLLSASAQTRNDAVPQVADLILAEIARLSGSEATEAELAPRKATLIGAFGRSLETVDGLGGLVANLALYGLPLSDLASYDDDVNGVTPAQIRAAAAEHLPASNASLVIVGDASQFLEALRAKYPNVEVIPLSALNIDSAALR
ncbi:zinc protease [Brevundimonas alba]|uniref:Zinc protease n=1 Tax=Brevundimonas alba TaxID=74314 RepID=A0A7X6BM37_9CAUL|nr:pitrilysin family protein [Brevundimonas alba]NJC40628.1 zinc protease [Brevundimonas alba]